MALYGLAALAHLLRYVPERYPHFALYETLMVLVDHLDDPDLAPALFVRFELAMLPNSASGWTCPPALPRHRAGSHQSRPRAGGR